MVQRFTGSILLFRLHPAVRSLYTINTYRFKLLEHSFGVCVGVRTVVISPKHVYFTGIMYVTFQHIDRSQCLHELEANKTSVPVRSSDLSGSMWSSISKEAFYIHVAEYQCHQKSGTFVHFMLH